MTTDIIEVPAGLVAECERLQFVAEWFGICGHGSEGYQSGVRDPFGNDILFRLFNAAPGVKREPAFSGVYEACLIFLNGVRWERGRRS